MCHLFYKSPFRFGKNYQKYLCPVTNHAWPGQGRIGILSYMVRPDKKVLFAF